jgi:hypothetical protein
MSFIRWKKIKLIAVCVVCKKDDFNITQSTHKEKDARKDVNDEINSNSHDYVAKIYNESLGNQLNHYSKKVLLSSAMIQQQTLKCN